MISLVYWQMWSYSCGKKQNKGISFDNMARKLLVYSKLMQLVICLLLTSWHVTWPGPQTSLQSCDVDKEKQVIITRCTRNIYRFALCSKSWRNQVNYDLWVLMRPINYLMCTCMGMCVHEHAPVCTVECIWKLPCWVLTPCLYAGWPQ